MSLADVFKMSPGRAADPKAGNAPEEGGLMLFYMPGCPYCSLAERTISALCAENPEYTKIPIRRVNEIAERALAQKYDYWYTPSLFLNGEKLYEADSSDSPDIVKSKLAVVLQKALEAQNAKPE